MVTEDQRYKAEALKISGFAFMTPFARFILTLIESGFGSAGIQLLVNVFISFLFFIIGIMIVQRGYEAVMEK